MRDALTDPSWPAAAGGARATVAGRRWVLPRVAGGADALLVSALLILAARFFLTLPALFGVDSWLELVAGRMIWHTGVPHHEILTVVAATRPWIDQPWLAQLAAYSLYRMGGLSLLGVTNVTLLISSLGIAVATARSRGASPRAILLPLALAAWLLLPATEIRTQAFALPIFAATVALLERDSRHPSRQVYWTLALLVLWANVHGSASLGAGLVCMRGLWLLWIRHSRIRARPRLLIRPLALIGGAPLALAATPYGLHSFAYYGSTLGNATLRQAVTEWQPLTSSPLVAVPFSLLAAAVLWSIVSDRRRSTGWGRAALLALGIASISVIRNAPFFALAALSLGPARARIGRGAKPEAPRAVNRRINASVLAAALALFSLAAIVALSRPATPRVGLYAASSLAGRLETAVGANPHVTVAADTRYGDWLLWQLPSLAGRLAIDARYELYSTSEITAYLDFVNASGRDWRRAAAGHRLVVLDRAADHASASAFRDEPGARTIFEDQNVIVIFRRAPAG